MSDHPHSAQPLQSVLADGDPLELLFREMAAAANQLRIATTLLNRADRLPPGGLSVLQVLGRGGRQTVPQIARFRMTSRQNIQVAVNRLAAQGLVETVSNPAHKRSVLYQLTEKGRTLLAEAEQRTVSLRNVLAAELGAASIPRMVDFLARMRETLARFGKEPGEKAIQVAAGKKRVGGARKAEAAKTTAPSATEDEGLVIPPPPPENEIPLSLL